MYIIKKKYSFNKYVADNGSIVNSIFCAIKFTTEEEAQNFIKNNKLDKNELEILTIS